MLHTYRLRHPSRDVPGLLPWGWHCDQCIDNPDATDGSGTAPTWAEADHAARDHLTSMHRPAEALPQHPTAIWALTAYLDDMESRVDQFERRRRVVRECAARALWGTAAVMFAVSVLVPGMGFLGLAGSPMILAALILDQDTFHP